MPNETEWKWIRSAMDQLYAGQLSGMQSAKVMRTIGQIFEKSAQQIELELVDKVENRLYN